MTTKWLASFSGGKDSTAMVHVILAMGLPLDGLLWFNSGWEWPETVDHVSLVARKVGIPLTVIVPPTAWNELLRKYGWPHWRRRWCTGEKMRLLDQAKQGCGAYVGLTADEQGRIAKYPTGSPVRFPLAEAGITQQDALAMCRRLGYKWSGLYDVVPRISCFCCPLQSVVSLRRMQAMRPNAYAKLCAMHHALPAAKRAAGWKHGKAPEDIATDVRKKMTGAYADFKRQRNKAQWATLCGDADRLAARREKDRNAKRLKRGYKVSGEKENT